MNEINSSASRAKRHAELGKSAFDVRPPRVGCRKAEVDRHRKSKGHLPGIPEHRVQHSDVRAHEDIGRVGHVVLKHRTHAREDLWRDLPKLLELVEHDDRSLPFLRGERVGEQAGSRE